MRDKSLVIGNTVNKYFKLKKEVYTRSFIMQYTIKFNKGIYRYHSKQLLIGHYMHYVYINTSVT